MSHDILVKKWSTESIPQNRRWSKQVEAGSPRNHGPRCIFFSILRRIARMPPDEPRKQCASRVFYYSEEEAHAKDAEIRGILGSKTQEETEQKGNMREPKSRNPMKPAIPPAYPQRRRNRGGFVWELTMLRRQEAEAEREEADAAAVASSRMAGQRRSKTRWLR